VFLPQGRLRLPWSAPHHGIIFILSLHSWKSLWIRRFPEFRGRFKIYRACRSISYPSATLRDLRTGGMRKRNLAHRPTPRRHNSLHRRSADVPYRGSRCTAVPSCCRREGCCHGHGLCGGQSAHEAVCPRIHGRIGRKSAGISWGPDRDNPRHASLVPAEPLQGSAQVVHCLVSLFSVCACGDCVTAAARCQRPLPY